MCYREALEIADKKPIGLKCHNLENFQTNVLNTLYVGRAIQSWTRAINSGDRAALQLLIDPSSSDPIH